MLYLREHALRTCGLPLDDPPEGCNLNKYSNGYGSIGAHADDEPIFNLSAHPGTILGFSLGETRRFEFWDDWNHKGTLAAAVELPSLSYVSMQGSFQ